MFFVLLKNPAISKRASLPSRLAGLESPKEISTNDINLTIFRFLFDEKLSQSDEALYHIF